MSKPKIEKICVVFKKSVLKSILQILMMEHPGFRNYKIIKNINILFTNLNLDKYKYNPDLLNYIWCIKNASQQWINGILNPDLIYEAIRLDPDFNDSKDQILKFAMATSEVMSAQEVQLIFSLINDSIQYGYIMAKKDDYINELENLDLNESNSYRKTVSKLFEISQSLMDIKHSTNLLTENKKVFNSSSTDSIKESIDKTFESLEASRNVFRTGIKQWNNLLSPGYENGRIYTYLGLPGAGKSTILLKSVLDIRKYNPNFQNKTPGMKPCVVYITMENSFPETMSRVWNMTFNDAIMNYSKEEAYEKLINALGISDDSEQNIEIVIQEYNYRELSPDDIYTIVKNLQEQNLEVVAIALDYLKRMRPAVPTPDNPKQELNQIINELKTLAKVLYIPVITAHQMNRVASAVVDGAVRQGKGDVTKLVGRENVGDAWEIIESSDVAIVLNREEKITQNGKKSYLVLSVCKRRSIDTANPNLVCNYMVHPFVDNSLKLIDDLYMEKSLSLKSLVTDIDDLNKEKQNAVSRLKNARYEFEKYAE